MGLSSLSHGLSEAAREFKVLSFLPPANVRINQVGRMIELRRHLNIRRRIQIHREVYIYKENRNSFEIRSLMFYEFDEYRYNKIK